MNLKKNILALLALLCTTMLNAQVAPPVQSKVYNWNDLVVEKLPTNNRRQVLDGTTLDLQQLEIHTSTLQPGNAPHAPHTHADIEELVIVREGKLKVTIKGKTKVLGPGSVALAIPGEEHGFENGGDTETTYYILKFKGKTPLDTARGKKAGGSFMIDWSDVPFVASERGGRRNIFDRPTAVFGRFEMHVTTLNKGLVSHAPHTHRAAEILLLMKGDAEMQIGETHNKTLPGGVVFLESMVPHALKNTGDGPCEYFAFQFQ